VGRLARAFATCALDASKLSQIDGLLSLQRRTATLPRARECFAGRYADFLRSFAETGIEHCPRWTKESTVNPITASTIDAVIPALRSLETRTAAEVLHDGEPSFQAAEALEEKNLYRAAFDAETSSPSSDAGTTAVACAGGFAGFVLGHDGDSVLTDPTAWLLDTVYPSAAADPYWRNGAYYHPMSQYGTLPGALFGNVNRYRPCPGCAPEFCSYYAGSHIKTALQLDCLDDNDWATCVSYCGPTLP
jgi:hypothetical protein